MTRRTPVPLAHVVRADAAEAERSVVGWHPVREDAVPAGFLKGGVVVEPEVLGLGMNAIEASIGDHICGFYNGRDELESMLYPYLETGVRDGDKTLCLIDSRKPRDVLDALRPHVDVDAALAAHQLEVKHSTESYLATGSFEVYDWIRQLRELSADSVDREGFPRMRAVGEMGWALRMLPGSDDLFVYEAEINRFIGDYRVLYLCLYDLTTIPGSMVMDAIKTHPRVLIGGCLFENPFFLEPERFLGTSPAPSTN
jgi:hypothetical protein